MPNPVLLDITTIAVIVIVAIVAVVDAGLVHIVLEMIALILVQQELIPLVIIIRPVFPAQQANIKVLRDRQVVMFVVLVAIPLAVPLVAHHAVPVPMQVVVDQVLVHIARVELTTQYRVAQVVLTHVVQVIMPPLALLVAMLVVLEVTLPYQDQVDVQHALLEPMHLLLD